MDVPAPLSSFVFSRNIWQWNHPDSLDDFTLRTPTYTPAGNPDSVSITMNLTVTVTSGAGCAASVSLDATL